MCTLFEAAKEGNYPQVAALLDRGAEIDQRNEWGWTLLMWACGHDAVDLVELLIERGANLDASTSRQEATALSIAIYNDNTEIANRLIEAGADVEKRFPDETAITFAAQYGRLPIIEKLLSVSAKVNARDKNGRTALMYAARGAGKKWKTTVSLLLDNGADVHAVDDGGANALIYAVWGRRTEIVRLLIKAGSAIDQRLWREKTTALMYAAEKRCLDICQLLVAGGASVDLRDHLGKTALMYAARGDQWSADASVMEYLVANGALTDIVDNKGNTLLFHAVSGKNVDCCAIAIDAGCDVNARNEAGETAIMYARDAETVSYLLDLGADIEARCKNGWTPLFHACINALCYCDSSAAQALVQRGAARTGRDNHGQPLLDLIGEEYEGYRQIDEGDRDQTRWFVYNELVDLLDQNE
jgi:ankyrin repeat protein